VFGPEARITVPTLNERNLRRYLAEGPRLRIAPIPSIYFGAIRRLVADHDLVMLVEGSSYMDTWSSALLWAFLWATRCAHDAGKPCLAYAVDAGEMRSSLNRRLVRSEASKTDLIIARSGAAAERLRSWGVSAPMEVTADNAFTFTPDRADEELLPRVWPGEDSGMVGIAPVDFYLWPVVFRPWGRRRDCYRWPYYFSRSAERCRLSDELATGYARLADRVAGELGRRVAFIAMEQLDEPLCQASRERMVRPDRARVFSSREYHASQLTVLLRSLAALATSRFHACVLSLAAAVPQVALGHDLRLATIYHDLGLDDWFIRPDEAAMFDRLRDGLAGLLADPEKQRPLLRRGFADHLARARRNRELLAGFARARGLPTSV